MKKNIENQIKELESHLEELKAPETDFDTAIDLYKNALKTAQQLNKTFDSCQKELQKLDTQTDQLTTSPPL